jgi:hypothetical protein
MSNHTLINYQLDPFWDDEYKNLDYINESFNDTALRTEWLEKGYADRFTGDMCDMRSPQPTWNQRFVDMFTGLGWKDIGTSYYRMGSGTILPMHGDLYLKYVDLFDLHGEEHNLRRAIVFLEDWQSGHYFESMGHACTDWKAGLVLEWTYNTPHMAANLGLTPRYTLQITGHI